MGLDMYLFATPSTTSNDANDVEEARNEVAYWRKANHIHGWFVDNVQDGIDECQYSPVTREQLESLRQLCVTTIATQNPKLLAPHAGFFFGTTEINKFYWQDITNTVEQLDTVLALPADMNIAYQSSW